MVAGTLPDQLTPTVAGRCREKESQDLLSMRFEDQIPMGRVKVVPAIMAVMPTVLANSLPRRLKTWQRWGIESYLKEGRRNDDDGGP